MINTLHSVSLGEMEAQSEEGFGAGVTDPSANDQRLRKAIK